MSTLDERRKFDVYRHKGKGSKKRQLAIGFDQIVESGGSPIEYKDIISIGLGKSPQLSTVNKKVTKTSNAHFFTLKVKESSTMEPNDAAASRRWTLKEYRTVNPGDRFHILSHVIQIVVPEEHRENIMKKLFEFEGHDEPLHPLWSRKQKPKFDKAQNGEDSASLNTFEVYRCKGKGTKKTEINIGIAQITESGGNAIEYQHILSIGLGKSIVISQRNSEITTMSNAHFFTLLVNDASVAENDRYKIKCYRAMTDEDRLKIVGQIIHHVVCSEDQFGILKKLNQMNGRDQPERVLWRRHQKKVSDYSSGSISSSESDTTAADVINESVLIHPKNKENESIHVSTPPPPPAHSQQESMSITHSTHKSLEIDEIKVMSTEELTRDNRKKSLLQEELNSLQMENENEIKKHQQCQQKLKSIQRERDGLMKENGRLRERLQGQKKRNTELLAQVEEKVNKLKNSNEVVALREALRDYEHVQSELRAAKDEIVHLKKELAVSRSTSLFTSATTSKCPSTELRNEEKRGEQSNHHSRKVSKRGKKNTVETQREQYVETVRLVLLPEDWQTFCGLMKKSGSYFQRTDQFGEEMGRYDLELRQIGREQFVDHLLWDLIVLFGKYPNEQMNLLKDYEKVILRQDDKELYRETLGAKLSRDYKMKIDSEANADKADNNVLQEFEQKLRDMEQQVAEQTKHSQCEIQSSITTEAADPTYPKLSLLTKLVQKGSKKQTKMILHGVTQTYTMKVVATPDGLDIGGNLFAFIDIRKIELGNTAQFLGNPSKRCCMILFTNNDAIQLQARNAAERTIWVKLIEDHVTATRENGIPLRF